VGTRVFPFHTLLGFGSCSSTPMLVVLAIRFPSVDTLSIEIDFDFSLPFPVLSRFLGLQFFLSLLTPPAGSPLVGGKKWSDHREQKFVRGERGSQSYCTVA
jgi:hypothetical protein